MKISPAEPGKEQAVARRRMRAAATLTLAAVLYAMVSGCSKPADLKTLATGPMAKLVVAAKPGAEPDIAFTGPDGKSMHLADLKGQIVVVNFWATWCGPCKEEMPSLAKLQKDYAGKPLKVVPISVDRAEDVAAAKEFLKKNGDLSFYSDPQYAVIFALDPRPQGIPITVIYDRRDRGFA